MTSSSWRGTEARTLRRAILSPASLVPLIQTRPERAAEVIVAAMLHTPRPRNWLGLRGGFGITDDIRMDDPLPENGPLFAFFVHAPDEAVDTLLTIVAHATEQWAKSEWAEVDDHPTDSEFEILTNGAPQKLVGNGNVLHWHRGDPRVPKTLTSALMALESHLYARIDGGEDVGALLSALMDSRLLAIYGVLVDVACYRPELLEGPLAALPTSAGILLNDRLYKAMNTGPYTLGLLSESKLNRLRSWHGMPHRKRTLESVVLPLVVGSGPPAGQMQAAREMWAKHPDNRWRYLIAQTDPANFRPLERDDGTTAWVFEMPTELQAEIDVDQAELDDQQWWATAPLQLARFIESEEEISDEAAQTFWDDVQAHLRQGSPPEDLAREGVLRQADVECGTAAALLIRAPAWTAARPEVVTFCREALTKPFASPPPTHAFDSPLEGVDWSWDGFAARALPRLWRATPDDQELRQLAVRLAIHPHRQTVRRFFSAIEDFDELRADRHRLEVLALSWGRFAAWRHERRHREDGAAYLRHDAPRGEDLPDLETPTRCLIDAFIEGTLRPELPDLKTYIDETPEGLLPKHARGVYRIAYAVDVSYLLSAWRHLLSLTCELDEAETARRLKIAQDLAEVFGSVWSSGDEDNGVPTSEERALLDALGAMTVDAPPNEARKIWEPILAAGAGAHYWVSHFLDDVWTAALARDPTPAHFVELIGQMMKFGADHPAWTGFRLSDIELSLLGLHRYGYPRMDERHVALLRALQPEWNDRARAVVLSGSYTARPVAAFLNTPAAAEIVDTGVGWLVELEQAGGRSDPDLDERVAELLVELAGRDPGIFRRVPAAGHLLASLVARQNAVALQLSAQLGRSG